MDRYGYNSEGYPDPTATEAIAKADNTNKAEKKYLPLVYVCSKYSGDTAANAKAARHYCRFAVDAGAIPLAPHLLFPQFMSDETERELAMFMNGVLLDKCDEMWVFGSETSEGMKAEIANAKRHRKKIKYFDGNCQRASKDLDIGPEE